MVETGRVAARGGEIAYHTAGDGPALVYLHGAGGLRWGKALDALATRFRVYALDLPGFGGSTLADDVNSIPTPPTSWPPRWPSWDAASACT